MVRREEQQWRNRVLLLLDTRRGAHAGHGPASSFEFAVSAAASIGMHLAREGLDGQLIMDTGAVTAPGVFEDVLLNSLAVIKPSRSRDLSSGLATLRGSSGLLVAVTGRLSPGAARQLAASRRDARPAIALLLDVATWDESADSPTTSTVYGGSATGTPDGKAAASANGRPGDGSTAEAGTGEGSTPDSRASNGRAAKSRAANGGRPGLSETDQAAAILRAAGWRVARLDASTPLQVAWQQLAAPAVAKPPVPQANARPEAAV